MTGEQGPFLAGFHTPQNPLLHLHYHLHGDPYVVAPDVVNDTRPASGGHRGKGIEETQHFGWKSKMPTASFLSTDPSSNKDRSLT